MAAMATGMSATEITRYGMETSGNLDLAASPKIPSISNATRIVVSRRAIRSAPFWVHIRQRATAAKNRGAQTPKRIQ